MSHMQSANEVPADIIGKVSGAVPGGKREDDGAYFTNNEGLPFPDPKTIGEIPVASDVFSFRSNRPSIDPRTLSAWSTHADLEHSATLSALKTLPT